MADFKRSLAVVIGINEYQDYPKLQTARYDAERLAEILAIEHKYDYVILVADKTYKEYLKGQELPVKNKYQPTLDGLRNLLSKRLPAEINPTQEDRLLFYFAGHGIPDDSDEGPKGYLVPLDADSKKRDTLLPMQELYKRLAALNCRHFLVVLDCCFAGRFSWSSTRKGRTFPKVIHKEHYDRFINSPAWQAITSASHDQEAFDSLGDRGTVEGTNHSPFAEGLFKALRGEADVIPAGKNGQPAGDGVITATELYLYLREHVENGSKERQTPGLWPLPKHERGEYIFLVPGAELKLEPAPPVDEKNNPYRGLESFDEEHSRFFFGREELIQQLSERISAPKQPLTVVSGKSGFGKSSLVKAGLIPRLKNLSKSEPFQANPINTVHQWLILNPMRPGEHPFTALAKTILALVDVTGSNQPDTLNFLKSSGHLDKLTFITEVLNQKVKDLGEKVADSSFENGEESSETLRLKKEGEKFNSITERWRQGTQKAKQLLIVEHFEELYILCRNSTEQQQLQQAVSDCLDPLSQNLQSDPNQLIDIVRAWSQKNPGVRLLLMIDQFEELITLSQSKQKEEHSNQQQQRKKFWNFWNQPNQEVQQENKQEEWQQFLNLLEKTLSANLEQLRIIVTLRSDFEPRFLNSDALKSYWTTQARFQVRAMRLDELRQVIEEPASEMALYFEPPNLVDKLIDEVGPEALPLLSFTLSELYIKLAQKWRIQETSDRALTLDADFDKQGGVAGSLTRRANEEYDNLPDDAYRATLRRVMLRMVTTEGGESARRRVPESELVYADATENDRVKEIIDRLVNVRLVVSGQETGEPYVEPAHDFLVRSWDKLQQWQQDEQEDLSLQRRLTPAALEWKSKQEARFLWNADPYLDVLNQVLTSEKDNWLNNIEAEFVKRSIQRRERNRRIRWSLIASAFSIVLGFAFIRWNQYQQAESLKLATSSKQHFSLDQQLDALVDGLKAGKTLQRAVNAPPEIRMQVVTALQQVVYGVKEHNRLQGHNARVNSVNFCNDGKRIASVSQDGIIKRWGLDGKELDTIDGQTDDVKSVSFSRDCKMVALGNRDATITLWSLDSKKSKKLIFLKGTATVWSRSSSEKSKKLVSLKGHTTSVTSVGFSPDSKLLASGTEDGIVTLWSINGDQLWTIQGHSTELNSENNNIGTVRSISFSPDGKTIASSGGGIKLWSLDGKLKNTLGYGYISFSPDGKMLVAASGTKITLWNLNGEQQWTRSLKDDEQRYQGTRSVSFSSDGKTIASASRDGIIKLWSLDGNQLSTINGHGDVNSLSFSLDGKTLAAGNDDGSIKLWSVSNEPLKTFKLDSSINRFSFSPDGKTIALGGFKQVTIWSWDGEKLKTFDVAPNASDTESSGQVTSLSFSPDGKSLAASANFIVQLWSLENGKELWKRPESGKNYSSSFSSVSFSPDGKIATPAGGKLLKLFSLDGKELKPLTLEGYSEDAISFSPDGKTLAVPNDDNIQRWRTADGKPLPSLKNEDQVIQGGSKTQATSIGFSPDSKILASGSYDGSIRFWSLENGKFISPPNRHTAKINSVNFSPDGKILASGSDDNTIKLWSLNGTELDKIEGYKRSRAYFSPDGKTLAVVSGDTVTLLNIDLNDLLRRGCDRARDYLHNNPNVSESDRHLCDDIPPSTPSPQTTTAN